MAVTVRGANRGTVPRVLEPPLGQFLRSQFLRSRIGRIEKVDF